MFGFQQRREIGLQLRATPLGDLVCSASQAVEEGVLASPIGMRIQHDMAMPDTEIDCEQ